MPNAFKPVPPTSLDPGKMKKWRQDLIAYVGHPPGDTDADSWGWLADAFVSDYLNRWNEADKDFPKAKFLLDEAENAVRRASGLPIGHYSMGMIHRAKGDHKSALKEFEKAVNGDPNRDYPRFHAQYGNQLINVGRPADALIPVNAAINAGGADLSLGVFHWILGRAYFFMPDYKKAIESLEKSVHGVKRDNLWHNRLYLVSAYALDGRLHDAKKELSDFDNKFRGYTLAQVSKQEQEIRHDNNDVIVAGLKQFHDGLQKAGMH